MSAEEKLQVPVKTASGEDKGHLSLDGAMLDERVRFRLIKEAAVIGKAHAEWGEVPVAYLVCEKAVDDRKLTTYCRGQLASFKVPRHFIRVASLPRNAMGKLQKHLLKPDSGLG